MRLAAPFKCNFHKTDFAGRLSYTMVIAGVNIGNIAPSGTEAFESGLQLLKKTVISCCHRQYGQTTQEAIVDEQAGVT